MTSDEPALPSAASLGLAAVVHHGTVDSTMDVAHELAASGAPAGTLVIADRQRRGRGRGGHRWESDEPRGLWMTLVERPTDQRVVGVLALRLGLALADALAPLVDGTIRLKWPNDLLVDDRKLAGILVEARWRDAAVDWVAIGIGINLETPPTYTSAAATVVGTTRATLLEATMPGIRAASSGASSLSAHEVERWSQRDWARGREIDQPVIGKVLGIAADGALMVQTAKTDHSSSDVVAVRSGSLRVR